MMLVMALASCGGGSSGIRAAGDSQGSFNLPTQGDSVAPGGEPQGSQPEVPPVVPANNAVNDDFPFSGAFMLDEDEPGFSSRYLGVIAISPTPLTKSRGLDGSHVAVEARYYLNSGYNTATLVFDINSQQIIATWEGGYATTWMPDIRPRAMEIWDFIGSMLPRAKSLTRW